MGDNRDDWFPPLELMKSDSWPGTARAKTICNHCPVRVPCLEYALGNEPYGTWGGVVAEDRAAIRNDQGLPPLWGAKWFVKEWRRRNDDASGTDH